MEGRILLAGLAVCAVAMSGCNRHREHPADHPAEHPRGAAQVGPTKDDLADAIGAWVQKQGGALEVQDEVAGGKLRLELVKVHRERLSKVGRNKYFACADFKAQNGKTYDLDVFMEGAAKDDLNYSDLTIHKEEGEARYTWYEDGGVWKKKWMAPGGAAAMEHPPKSGMKEHPAGAEHPSEHPR
jgi:hypothetical protein